MLIPIGFFGAGAAAGAYELISTVTGTTSTTTFDVSSLGSTYKHLQIRGTLRTGTTNVNVDYTGGSGYIILNNGAAVTTSSHRLLANGTTVSSAATTSGTNSTIANSLVYAGGGTEAGNHSAVIIDFLDFASSSKNKTIRSFSGGITSSGTDYLLLSSGLFASTSPITAIRIGGGYTTTSRLSLYGIKG